MSKTHWPVKALRVGIRLIVVGACIVVISFLVQQAIAQLSAELEYQSALVQRGIPQIQSVFKAAQQQPNGYDYQRLLGQAYARQSYQSQSLERQLRKLQLRPSWPFAWFDFAQWHVHNHGLASDKFEFALARSEELGRNESSLRKARARLALAVLDRELSLGARAQLREALTREFDARPQYIYARAALRGREGIVCAHLNELDGVTKWCDQMDYFRQVCAVDVAKAKKHRDWCKGMRLMWESWV